MTGKRHPKVRTDDSIGRQEEYFPSIAIYVLRQWHGRIYRFIRILDKRRAMMFR